MCIQYGREERFDIVYENSREYFRVITNRTDDGWEVFYMIPLRFIKLFHRDFSFDRSLRINMYKCGDHTPHKHYLAWKPIDTDKPNFHTPEYFWEISFGP